MNEALTNIYFRGMQYYELIQSGRIRKQTSNSVFSDLAALQVPIVKIIQNFVFHKSFRNLLIGAILAQIPCL